MYLDEPATHDQASLVHMLDMLRTVPAYPVAFLGVCDIILTPDSDNDPLSSHMHVAHERFVTFWIAKGHSPHRISVLCRQASPRSYHIPNNAIFPYSMPICGDVTKYHNMSIEYTLRSYKQGHSGPCQPCERAVREHYPEPVHILSWDQKDTCLLVSYNLGL